MTTETLQRQQPKKKKFLEGYLAKGTVTAGARIAGIHRVTIYDWLKADLSFAREFEQAKEAVADDLEEEAIRRAKDSSDTMLIFMLKGHKPEKYKDKVEHSGKVQHEITKAEDLDDDTLAGIAAGSGNRTSKKAKGAK